MKMKNYILDRTDIQHGKLIVHGKNEVLTHEEKPVVRKPFVPMHAINQRKENVEKNAKQLIQKLSPILNREKNQSVTGQNLMSSGKKDLVNEASTGADDRSGLANTLKAVSLLAHLHSMSLAQQNQSQHKKNGLIEIANTNTESQKHDNLMKNQHGNTEKWVLSKEDISEIDRFTLELKKLIDESTGGALRRNPRYSYLYDAGSRNFADNEPGMNEANTMNAGNPSTISSESTNESKQGNNMMEGKLVGRSTTEMVITSDSEFANDSMESKINDRVGKYGNESDDGLSSKGEDEHNDNLNLKTQKSRIEINGNNDMNDESIHGEIKEVSILSNGREEKIIYASKSVEDETETVGTNFPDDVLNINFKKVKCMIFKFNKFFMQSFIC